MTGEQAEASTSRPNEIMISAKKKPNFYVDLVKNKLEHNSEVELIGLGTATPTVCTVAEILKSKRIANVTKINTSLLTVAEGSGKAQSKPKLQVTVVKGEKFVPRPARKTEPKAEAPVAATAAPTN